MKRARPETERLRVELDAAKADERRYAAELDAANETLQAAFRAKDDPAFERAHHAVTAARKKCEMAASNAAQLEAALAGATVDEDRANERALARDLQSDALREQARVFEQRIIDVLRVALAPVLADHVAACRPLEVKAAKLSELMVRLKHESIAGVQCSDGRASIAQLSELPGLPHAVNEAIQSTAPGPERRALELLRAALDYPRVEAEVTRYSGVISSLRGQVAQLTGKDPFNGQAATRAPNERKQVK